jgi:hypothetical protein
VVFPDACGRLSGSARPRNALSSALCDNTNVMSGSSLQDVMNASSAVFGPSGLVRRVSDATQAYRRIARDRSVSCQELERALPNATPAGRVYVSALVCELYPDEAARVLQSILDDATPIAFHLFDARSLPTSVRACARWLLSGCPSQAPELDIPAHDACDEGEPKLRAIADALDRAGGNGKEAAALLGIRRRELHRRITEFDRECGNLERGWPRVMHYLPHSRPRRGAWETYRDQVRELRAKAGDDRALSKVAWGPYFGERQELRYELLDKRRETERLAPDDEEFMAQYELVNEAAACLTADTQDFAAITEALAGEDWTSWFAVRTLCRRGLFPRAYLEPLVRKAVTVSPDQSGGHIIEVASMAYGHDAVLGVFLDLAREGQLSESQYRLLRYYLRGRVHDGHEPGPKVDSTAVYEAIRQQPTPALDDLTTR